MLTKSFIIFSTVMIFVNFAGSSHRRGSKQLHTWGSKDGLRIWLHVSFVNEYAKLLKFKPPIPRRAVELCSEMMACPAKGTWEKFMVESMVKSPSDLTPCTLPPPYDPSSLQGFLRERINQ